MCPAKKNERGVGTILSVVTTCRRRSEEIVQIMTSVRQVILSFTYTYCMYCTYHVLYSHYKYYYQIIEFEIQMESHFLLEKIHLFGYVNFTYFGESKIPSKCDHTNHLTLERSPHSTMLCSTTTFTQSTHALPTQSTTIMMTGIEPSVSLNHSMSQTTILNLKNLLQSPNQKGRRIDWILQRVGYREIIRLRRGPSKSGLVIFITRGL